MTKVGENTSHGPLAGVRLVELGGIGPVEFAGMAMADLGADVVRVARSGDVAEPPRSLSRGRTIVRADLRADADRRLVLRLARHADIAIEGFRPGVAERLGVGPDDTMGQNPRLVYGRMSGWGRSGPLASEPGHDINYIALAGSLHCMRRPGGIPVVSPGYVGDFGGAGMSLTVGLLAALFEAKTSGLGQVVDCSIVAGASWISAALLDQLNADPAAAGLATGAAPFYNVYTCQDGGFIAVGALEPDFYAAFIALLGLDKADWADQFALDRWPQRIKEVAAVFAARDRNSWVADPRAASACVTAVLTPSEAQHEQQNRAGELFVSRESGPQPNLAPRLSRTPGGAAAPAVTAVLTDAVARWAGHE
jgi:alpha-methylacyl-CoA racemase